MMKNNKGITLTALVITVVVMMIVIGVSTISVYTGINDYKDNRLAIELGIVRQAIVEQYEKAKAVNQLQSTQESNFWVGEKITSISNIDLPEGASLYNSENYNPQYAEDYYYRLDEDDLSVLGLQDSVYTYVVRYSTGEVYNEKKKVNSQGELVYLLPLNYIEQKKKEDTTSFNDWK